MFYLRHREVESLEEVIALPGLSYWDMISKPYIKIKNWIHLIPLIQGPPVSSLQGHAFCSHSYHLEATGCSLES